MKRVSHVTACAGLSRPGCGSDLSSMPSPSLLLPRSFSLPSDRFQEPRVVYTDAPPTPPLSPPRTSACLPVDPQPASTPESQPVVPQISTSELMDVDTDTVEDESSPTRPQRLLEDEQVHLQRSGIRLSDFEVRGTLCMPFLVSPYS